MSTTVIPVSTPTGGYDVHVGRSLLGELPALLPEHARRVVIVHQPSLRDVAEQLRAAIAESDRQAFAAEVMPQGVVLLGAGALVAAAGLVLIGLRRHS